MITPRILFGLSLAVASLVSQDMVKVLEKELPPEVLSKPDQNAIIEENLDRLAYRSPESIPYFVKYLEFTVTGKQQDSAIIYHNHSKRLEYFNVEAQRQWQRNQVQQIEDIEDNYFIRRRTTRRFKTLPKNIVYDPNEYHDPAPMKEALKDYFAVKVLLGDTSLSYIPGNNYSAIRSDVEQGFLREWNDALKRMDEEAQLTALPDPVKVGQYYRLIQRYPELMQLDPIRINMGAIQRYYTREPEYQYRVRLSRIPLNNGAPVTFTMRHSIEDKFELQKEYTDSFSMDGWVLAFGRKHFLNSYRLPFSYIDLSVAFGHLKSDLDLGLGSSVLVVGNSRSSYYERFTADSNKVHLNYANTIDLRMATPVLSLAHFLNMEIGAGIQYRGSRITHDYTLHWILNTQYWSYETEPPVFIRDSDSWDGERSHQELNVHEFFYHPFVNLEMMTPLPYVTLSGSYNGKQSWLGINFLF